MSFQRINVLTPSYTAEQLKHATAMAAALVNRLTNGRGVEHLPSTILCIGFEQNSRPAGKHIEITVDIADLPNVYLGRIDGQDVHFDHGLGGFERSYWYNNLQQLVGNAAFKKCSHPHPAFTAH